MTMLWRNHLCLSAWCLLISLTVPSISFSLSLSVSLRAWVVSSSSATLTCSVTLDLLGGERLGGQGVRTGWG